VIRVLVADDHPAMRAGLRVCLRGEPGLVPVGAADSADSAVRTARSVRADVVVLDLHLPGEGGLHAACRLKAGPQPPRVLLFTAFAHDALLVPARIAGVDGVLGKEAGGDALFDAIRRVHANGCSLPAPDVEQVRATMASLEEDEQPIAAMLLAGIASSDIAATLRLDPVDLDALLQRMFTRLQAGSA
jgi:DNA-binding NarL/FixJ family response regulator